MHGSKTFHGGEKHRGRKFDKVEEESPLSPCWPGDDVTYYSNTYKTNMETKVTRSFKIEGVQYYDLDCKPRALATNVTRRPNRYNVGDLVRYFSETHWQEMEAEVTKVYPDDPKYVDLNIKARAMEERIRPRIVSEPSISDADAAAGGGRGKEVWLYGLGKPRGPAEVQDLEASRFEGEDQDQHQDQDQDRDHELQLEEQQEQELEALPQHPPLEEAPEDPRPLDPSSPLRRRQQQQQQQQVPQLQIVQPPSLGFPDFSDYSELPRPDSPGCLDAPEEPPQPRELLQRQDQQEEQPQEQHEEQQQQQQQQQQQPQRQEEKLPERLNEQQSHQHQQQEEHLQQQQQQQQPQEQQREPQQPAPQVQPPQHTLPQQHQQQYLQQNPQHPVQPQVQMKAHSQGQPQLLHLQQPQQPQQPQQQIRPVQATPPQVQPQPVLAISRQYQAPVNGEVGRPHSPIRIAKTHVQGQPARTPTNFAASESVVCTPVSGCPDPSPTRLARSNSSLMVKAQGGYQLKSGETLAATHEHPPIPLHQPSPGRQHAHYTSFGQAQVVNRGTTPPPRVNPQVSTTPSGNHSARGGPAITPYRNGKSTALVTGRPIQFGDLSLIADTFNPTNQAFLPLLLKALDMPPNTIVKEMQGFKGGLNEGVWFAQCPNRAELVLKLVRCYRIASNVLTEAENFRKLQQDHPQILHDTLIAFPAKILGCIDRAGKKKHDLIVMHRVPGERLAEWIARTWHSADRQSVLARFEELGGVLAQFHQRYGNVQHGDFQPSNVFYDEATSSFSFIDVGGMGVPTTDNDVEHFVHSLSILSEPYGRGFAAEGRMYFERGYYANRGVH